MRPRTYLVGIPAVFLLAAAVAACGSAVSGTAAFGPISVIKHCPKGASFRRGATSLGTEGQTVPADPATALVCRWTEKDGRVQRAEKSVRGTALANLADALNSLPKPFQGETESCGGGPYLSYLIVLGYPGEAEVEVLADLGEANICNSVLNRAERTVYGGSHELESTLDAILGG